MIAQASDYRFVDFANGDLPTGAFDGSIMPLRQGAEKKELRAEDIAFLHECVQDKIGAFSGLSMEFSVPSSYTEGTTVALTRELSGLQMRNIRQRLATALSRGLANYGVGFLRTPLVECANMFPHELGTANLSQFMAYLDTQYGLTSTPTSSQDDFAYRAGIEAAPAESLFTDAQNLAMPVFRWLKCFDDANLENHLVEGSDMPTLNPGLGWIMRNDYNGKTGGAWRYAKGDSALELASVPDDLLASADIYLAYAAYNSIRYTEEYAEQEDLDAINTWYYAYGLVKLNPTYAHRVTDNGRIKFLTTALDSYSLINRIISDSQWTVHHTGSQVVRTQTISVHADGNTLIVGTPNGRTKWWS